MGSHFVFCCLSVVVSSSTASTAAGSVSSCGSSSSESSSAAAVACAASSVAAADSCVAADEAGSAVAAADSAEREAGLARWREVLKNATSSSNVDGYRRRKRVDFEQIDQAELERLSTQLTAMIDEEWGPIEFKTVFPNMDPAARGQRIM